MLSNQEVYDLLMKNYPTELSNNNFDKIFKGIGSYDRATVARFLIQDAGIPILDYMSIIYTNMFNGYVSSDPVGWKGTLVVPGNIKTIERNAFSAPTFGTIKMLSGIEKIGINNFSYSSNLEVIIFPEGLKKIETNTCIECDNLKKVYIPKSVTRIAQGCFKGDPDDIVMVTEWRDAAAEKLNIPAVDKEWYRQHLKFRGKTKTQPVAQPTSTTQGEEA